MLSTELAATAEALYDRALVRGEQLMHCRACDVKAIIDAARAPRRVNVGEPLECAVAALEAKIAELEAWQKDVAAHNDRLTADLAAAEAKIDEADRLLAANGQAGLELATALAEKGRFESLALEAATQNEQLQKALAEKSAQPAELEAKVAELSANLAECSNAWQSAVLRLNAANEEKGRLDAEAQAAAKALEVAHAAALINAAELEALKAADAAKAETIAKLETTVAGLKAAIAASA